MRRRLVLASLCLLTFLALTLAASAEEPTSASIPEIQGADHRSGFEGKRVTTGGVVIALDGDRGFFVQDPAGDGDPATSDALYVFTRESEGLPTVELGMELRITGKVDEIGRRGELTQTCLRPTGVEVLAVGRELPAAVVIGRQGRVPPSVVLDDDRLQNFDPHDDGLDFYESLESMWVEIREPLVVGPKNRYGDFALVADGGADATVLTARGGLLRRSGDDNPEALVVDGRRVEVPDLDVGDRLSAPVRGVIGYAFGQYRLLARGEIPPAQPSGVPEPSAATELRSGPTALTVGTFNVLNLAATDDEAKYRRLAEVVVEAMGAPDVVALQEVQDDNGAVDDGTVSADLTLGRLARTIEALGGPSYAWKQVDPENNADGGAPGSNIRVAFLLRPDRVETGEPRRIVDPAFDPVPAEEIGGTRKPLVLPIRFADHELHLVNLHLASRRRDDRAMGSTQPPVLHSEPRRIAQARAVRRVVDGLGESAPGSGIVVLGDFNEYGWSPAVRILMGSDLENLAERVPEAERYSFNFGGTSQLLDQVLLSRSLAAGTAIDIVHACSDFAAERAASDHDPVVVRLDFGG